MAVSKELYCQLFNVQVEANKETCPSRVHTGPIFVSDIGSRSELQMTPSGAIDTPEGRDATQRDLTSVRYGPYKPHEIQQRQEQGPAPDSG